MNLPEFDGTEECRWCETTPPAGTPKTRVEVGNTVRFAACTTCACDRDNLMQPRKDPA